MPGLLLDVAPPPPAAGPDPVLALLLGIDPAGPLLAVLGLSLVLVAFACLPPEGFDASLHSRDLGARRSAPADPRPSVGRRPLRVRFRGLGNRTGPWGVVPLSVRVLAAFKAWLGVPEANAAAAADGNDGPIPPGVYEVARGTALTGYEPDSFYRARRVGDSARVEIRFAP